jgi:hypothetical protein
MDQAATSFQCAECDRTIEGQPVWFDPFARRVRTDAQSLELQGLASATPNSPGALPFHQECLRRRLENA